MRSDAQRGLFEYQDRQMLWCVPSRIRTSRHVLIEVSDTGIGMESATRSKIFEPFFTTKETEGGTGLGLANVREILARRGGEIRFETALGRGSTFQVFLPCVVSHDQYEGGTARGSLRKP
jgi:signal transduction histidine kinase